MAAPEKLRILIAEDEKNIGFLLVDLLSKEGREIKVVHDGLEALQELKQQSYDLLITDLMMPEVDGLEVMHQARILHPDILIIVMTGYASLETAIQAVKEGAYDYLRKPFRLDELKISVDNACEKILLERENRRLLDKVKECINKYTASSQETPDQEVEPPAQEPIIPLDWIPPPEYFQGGTFSPHRAVSELERLASLKDQGVITQEEFSLLKSRLMERLK